MPLMTRNLGPRPMRYFDIEGERYWTQDGRHFYSCRDGTRTSAELGRRLAALDTQPAAAASPRPPRPSRTPRQPDAKRPKRR